MTNTLDLAAPNLNEDVARRDRLEMALESIQATKELSINNYDEFFDRELEWHKRAERQKPYVSNKMWGLLQAYYKVTAGPSGMLYILAMFDGTSSIRGYERERILKWWDGSAIRDVLIDHAPDCLEQWERVVEHDIPIARVRNVIKDVIECEIRLITSRE